MGERTSNQMENLSIQAKNRSPRDLLQRFRADTSEAPGRSDPEEDLGSGSGEVELNLGLSLGGRFDVDKSDSKLVRSSSIAAILPVVRDDAVLGSNTGPGGSHSSLARTASLPVETEDEWRKRKELQSLRRLAAKRRRSEKQRRVNGDEREEYVAAMRHVGSSAGPPFGSGNWVSGDGAAPATVESQGSVSELESGHLQGSSGSGCEASSLQERSNQDVTGSSRSNPEVRHEPKCQARNKGKEVRSSVVEDMPCVFTKGDGPNGRRIEGILYKYAKGEQVKIMCVCHGSFLSPAEFVRHAGGTDVVHPLRHIVINPSSFS